MSNGQGSGDLKPTKWWQWVLVYPTLLISLVGAIPQFTEWYQAYKLQVPARALTLAIEQNKLWEKNFDCTKNTTPHAFKTVTNADVEVIGCPSGDLLVKVQKPDSPDMFYRWIGSNNVLGQIAYLIPGVREAFAEPLHLQAGMLLAQAETIVLCQTRDTNGFILRRIQLPNGQCEEQLINPYTGIVVSRKPAPCKSC